MKAKSNSLSRVAVSLALLLAGCLFGCGQSLFIPEGDPAAGRIAFEKMECWSCHRVVGDKLPDPVAQPPVPVLLGNPSDRKSRDYLAESIIAPSHRFAKPPPVFATEPGMARQAKYENIREGESSRMGDYSEFMTVRELVDLVAYIESAQNRRPGIK